MESVASNSNSTPPNNNNNNNRHRPYRFKHSQPISDRIVRALRHPLRLLHRSGSTFFIFGATGNVYTVILSSTPTCTCPDRTTPCKHILFVMIRVLGVSQNDACVRRKNLRPCHLQRLLDMPTLQEAVAGFTLRQRFHQMFFEGGSKKENIEMEDGTTCPVCLEEMEKEERLVACGTCKNVIHEECLVRWKRSRGRRSASCVICRAGWRDRNEQDKYVNLSAYISEEDMLAQPYGDICTS